ncbi:MAG: hypothetical protein AAFW75_29290, partial [Cyanobacteria bacterium J06636_16]
MLTVVAGSCGAGKTTWILQELAQTPAAAVYVTPGVGTVPIDERSRPRETEWPRASHQWEPFRLPVSRK